MFTVHSFLSETLPFYKHRWITLLRQLRFIVAGPPAARSPAIYIKLLFSYSLPGPEGMIWPNPLVCLSGCLAVSGSQPIVSIFPLQYLFHWSPSHPIEANLMTQTFQIKQAIRYIQTAIRCGECGHFRNSSSRALLQQMGSALSKVSV
jgi:hypothetical protein